jgi:transcription antitermination factor NusG
MAQFDRLTQHLVGRPLQAYLPQVRLSTTLFRTRVGERMPCWALAVTQPNSELRTSARLTAAGVQHRLFKCRQYVVRHGIRLARFVPAFSRYVFVWVVDGTWDAIKQIKGVSGFVKIGDRYAEVSQSVIDTWSARADTHDVLQGEFEQAPSKFTFGDKIVVNDSHVAYGLEGVYQFAARPGRACVLIPWLGQLVLVDVNEDYIEKLSAVTASHQRRNKQRRGRRSNVRSRLMKKKHNDLQRLRHPLH